MGRLWKAVCLFEMIKDIDRFGESFWLEFFFKKKISADLLLILKRRRQTMANACLGSGLGSGSGSGGRITLVVQKREIIECCKKNKQTNKQTNKTKQAQTYRKIRNRRESNNFCFVYIL